MRKRFREYGTGARKPSTAAERPPLVNCLYCPKGTNVRRDRIEAHTRKAHPNKRMPSFTPLPPARLSDSPPDRTAKATTPAKIARAEKPSATKPTDRTLGSAKHAAEERYGRDRPFHNYSARQAPSPADRPPNWEVCAKMGFGELRAYIDKRLDRSTKAMTSPPYGEQSAYQSSQAKDRLLDLLGLLARKVLEGGHFYGDLQASTEDERRLRALRLREKELGAALVEAKRGSAGGRKKPKQLRAELRQLSAKIREVAAEERRLRSKPLTAAERRRRLQLRRIEIVERIGRDIERVFGITGSGGELVTGELSWSLLPPGELSPDTLRRHYSGLQQRHPHIRYDPERIEKAFSLEPNGCYVGRDEFDGYVVFTFAHTEKALLECPVFGNAIYVIGSDWRRLSRLSKRNLLANRAGGARKIVHRGDWFTRVKRELGIS